MIGDWLFSGIMFDMGRGLKVAVSALFGLFYKIILRCYLQLRVDNINNCDTIGLNSNKEKGGKMSKLLTLKEVSERLRLHINTIREYVKEGKIPAIQFDRAWRVEERDLEEFVRSRKQRVKK